MPLVRIILISVFCLMVILSFIGCDRSTGVQKGSLTGRVLLADEQTNHAGVLIELFPASVLPDSLAQTIHEYPDIGFELSQYHLVMDGKQSSIAHATTNAEGMFTLDRVSYGSYNVRCSKEGYSDYWVTDVDIYSESVDLNGTLRSDFRAKNESGEIAINPKIRMGGVIDSTFVFRRHTQYIIQEDVFTSRGSYCIFEEGTKVSFYPMKSMTINGRVMFQDGNYPIVFDAFNNTEQNDLWGELRVTELAEVDDNSIVNVMISDSMQGLILIGSNLNVTRSYFYNSSYGIYAYNSQDVQVFNCIFRELSNTDDGSIFFDISNDCKVLSSIFWYNTISVSSRLSSVMLSNNLISYSDEGIRSSFSSVDSIHNNDISNCLIGIRCANGSQPLIEYNSIHNCDKAISLEYIQFTHPLNDRPMIHYNNLIGSQWSLYMKPGIHGGGESYDVQAQNNYFGTSSMDEVLSRIYDNRNGSNPYDWPFWKFIIEPIALTAFSAAGITVEE